MPGSGPAAADLWNACTRELRARVPDSTWRTSLEPAHPLALDEERLVLAVSNSVIKERLEQRHLGLLEDVVAALGGVPRKVVIQVAQPFDFSPRAMCSRRCRLRRRRSTPPPPPGRCRATAPWSTSSV